MASGVVRNCQGPNAGCFVSCSKARGPSIITKPSASGQVKSGLVRSGLAWPGVLGGWLGGSNGPFGPPLGPLWAPWRAQGPLGAPWSAMVQPTILQTLFNSVVPNQYIIVKITLVALRGSI